LEVRDEKALHDFAHGSDSMLYGRLLGQGIDGSWYDPSNSPNPISKEETHEFLVKALKLFKKMTHKIEEIIAVKDKVIVRTVNYATHEGEFQGIPVTGKEVVFSGIAIFQIKDGKVIKVWEEADKLGWFQQLGMELKPKEEQK
jgi:predicted ester cyclase